VKTFQPSSVNAAAAIASFSAPEPTAQAKNLQKTATPATAQQSQFVLEAKGFQQTALFKTNVGHSQLSSGEEPAALTAVSAPKSSTDSKAAGVDRVILPKPNAFQPSSANKTVATAPVSAPKPTTQAKVVAVRNLIQNAAMVEPVSEKGWCSQMSLRSNLHRRHSLLPRKTQ
jgi:hypothetical protein